MPALMNKSSASPAAAPRLCPTCGTRVGAAATKCLVCGADLTPMVDEQRSQQTYLRKVREEFPAQLPPPPGARATAPAVRTIL